MKKSKFIVFTLLIALFSLCFVNFGSNKQEVYAAEATLQDETEIEEVTLQDEADIAAANVPSTVILSFPVTHISSYENEIDWEVIYGEEYVSYDRDAKWMVVSRSTEEDRTAILKVTVSDGENSSSATKTITIPAGFTAAPVYKINYNLNDGVNNENNPSTYKLGDATITLQNPAREGYTFQGWEDAEGNKIEKILVGSRKEISLTATWAEKQLSDVVIKTQPTKLTYNALENFDATGLVVTEYYDNGTQQDVTYVGNESSFAFSVTQLQGTDNGQKVVVTYEGYELETSALTVNRLTYDMSQVKWNHSSPYTYNGEEREVVLTGLPNGVTATYENNTATKVGNYTASVILDYDEVNYNAPEAIANLSWSIVAATFDMSNVKWNHSSPYTYNGEERKVVLTGLPNGVTANYEDNKATNAGDYQAKVTFAFDDENYDLVYGENEFSATLDWSIDKAKVYYTATPKTAFAVGQTPEWDYTYVSGLVEGETTSLINLSQVTAKYYQGEQEVQITQLPAGAGFTAKFIGATADNYDVVIDNYTGSISTVSIYFLPSQTYTYNTQAQTFAAKAYYNDNGNPVEIKDGTISYSYGENNSAVETNAGTYKVTVTLSGSQYGSLTSIVDFVIEKAKISMKDAAWNYTDPYTYNPEVTRTVSLTLPTLVTATYQNNSAKDAGEYNAVATLAYDSDNYVLVEMPQNLVYDAIEGTISLDWKINPAQIDMSSVAWDYSDALVYSKSGHTVEVKNLPANVTVQYTGNTGTDVDNYQATATFTPADNYVLINNNLGALNWSIRKAQIDMTGVDWVYEDGSFTYDTFEKEVQLSTLPEGVKATYSNNKGTDAQEYTATVELAPVDADNYELINVEVEALTWKIQKATYDFAVEWNYKDPYTYSGSDQSVKVTNTPDGLTPVYTGVYSAKDANTYTATVTFTNSNSNYNDTDITSELTWKINPKTLTNEDVTITVLGEDRNEQNSITLEPDVEVMYNAVKVTTYALSHSYDAETNEGVVTITLNGNYTGTLTAEFTASDYGQAYVDAQTLSTSLEDPTSLPLTVGSSNVFWTNLPTGLVLNQETGALSYAKPEADLVYVVEATVYYGLTSTHVVEVTITITGVNQQVDDATGIITTGEDAILKVQEEENPNYQITDENGAEHEILASYDITFEGRDEADTSEVTIKIPLLDEWKNKELQVWHITNKETGAKEPVESTNDGEYITFTATSFSPYVVTVKKEVVEEESVIKDGQYVIIATAKSKENSTYFLMTSDLGTASTKRYTAFDTELTVVDDLASMTSYPTNAVWKLVAKDNGYVLQTYDGKYYANWSSGNSGTLVESEEEAKVLTIEYDEENETYTMHFTATDGERYVSLNGTTGNDYFAFYKGSQKQDLVVIPVKAGSGTDPIQTYNVTVAVEGNGTATVNGKDRLDSLLGETQITLEINPNENNILSSIIINEEPLEDLTQLTFTVDKTTVIKVTFVEDSNGGDDNGGSEGGTENPTGSWTLVTDVSELVDGDQIIIVSKDANYAMGSDKGNNRGAVSITKNNNNTLTIADGVEIITLEADTADGTFAFNVNGSYLYAASSSGNQLKTKATKDVNGIWTIVINNNSGTSIVAKSSSNRNVMQYNPNNGSPLFSCYSSASQRALVIYKLNGGSTELTDEEKVQKALDSVEVPSEVEADFTLTDLTGVASYAWSIVSGTGIELEGLNAKVTRTEADQTVVLKLEVTIGEVTDETTFTVIVKAQGAGGTTTTEDTYSYTFTSKVYSANGDKTLSEVTWTLNGNGNYWGYDGTKGQQFGSKNNPYGELTLSTEGISGTIKSIKINTSGGSGINGSFEVTVGGVQYGNKTSLTTSVTQYTFTGESSGKIEFSYTQTSSVAIYIKSIEIVYQTSSN